MSSTETTNLGLPKKASGIVALKHSFRAAMDMIDAAFGARGADNGMPATPLKLTDALSDDTGTATHDGGGATPHTPTIDTNAIVLRGTAADSNTATDISYFEMNLPPEYVAGEDVIVTAYAELVGTGTVGATKTIDFSVYRQSTAGAVGADICATAAQALADANAAKAFTVTGTTLSPGDKLILKMTTAVQETVGDNTLLAQINAIIVS
jgi:hypothetical protein